MTSSSSRPRIAANPFVTPDLIGGPVMPGLTGCLRVPVVAGNDVFPRHARPDRASPYTVTS